MKMILNLGQAFLKVDQTFIFGTDNLFFIKFCCPTETIFYNYRLKFEY